MAMLNNQRVVLGGHLIGLAESMQRLHRWSQFHVLHGGLAGPPGGQGMATFRARRWNIFFPPLKVRKTTHAHTHIYIYTLHYISLHYSTLHCIALHLHYIDICICICIYIYHCSYITLHYVALRCIMLHYITLTLHLHLHLHLHLNIYHCITLH